MIALNNLRRGFERFCFRNRDKGIPNLMLYIALGNALVIVMSMINGGIVLYELLSFDKTKILEGQVWRLFTYVFTQSGIVRPNSGIIDLLFLYFFYLIGRHIENSMGVFKFNLYYFSGVILMDIFAMIFCPVLPADGMVPSDQYEYFANVLPVYWSMANYLHLSLILVYATLHPDSQFLILYIIPIKGWVLALIYLGMEVYQILTLSFPDLYFPHNLFPLVALANYLLFMGSDIKNLLPLSWRVKAGKAVPKTPAKRTGVTPLPGSMDYKRPAPQPQDYNHRCTVCGRTDTEFPDLEFRYCSRCAGYHCYCEDHINNHEHIEE